MVATVASDALQRPSSSLRGRRSWRGALVFGLGFTTLSKLGDASRCTEAASYNFDVVDVGGGGWHGATVTFVQCNGEHISSSTFESASYLKTSMCLPEEFIVAVSEPTDGANDEVSWVLSTAFDGEVVVKGGAPFYLDKCSRLPHDTLLKSWRRTGSGRDTGMSAVAQRFLEAKKSPSESAKPDAALEDMSKRVSSAAQKLFRIVDTTGDGQIEKFEMIAAADKLHLTEEEAEKLFNVLDTDDSGMLTLDEFSSYDLDSASPGMPSPSDDTFFSEGGPSLVSVSMKMTAEDFLTETQEETLKSVITDLAGIDLKAIASFTVEAPPKEPTLDLSKPVAPAPAPKPAPDVPKPTATKELPAMPMFPNPSAMLPPSSKDSDASKAMPPTLDKSVPMPKPAAKPEPESKPKPAPDPPIPKPKSTKKMPAMPMFPNPAAMLPPSTEDGATSSAAPPMPVFALPPAPDSVSQVKARRRLSDVPLTVIVEVEKKDANAVSIALADESLTLKLKAADSPIVLTVDTSSVKPAPVEYVTLKLQVDSELTEAQETILKDVISKEAGLDKSAITKFKVLLTPIAKLFKLVDTSGDGKIQKDEMMSAAPKLHLSESEAADLFDELDADGSGYLSLEEFEATENPAQFISLFELVDLDGSGNISKEEMIAAADKLQMTEEEAQDMFYELDTDGSGFLSEDEFGPAEASASRRRLSGEVSVLIEVPYGSAGTVSTAVSKDTFPEKVAKADSSLLVKTLSVSPEPKAEQKEADTEEKAIEEEVETEVEDEPKEHNSEAENDEEKPRKVVEDDGSKAEEPRSHDYSARSDVSNETSSSEIGSDDASAASELIDFGESLADVNQGLVKSSGLDTSALFLAVLTIALGGAILSVIVTMLFAACNIGCTRPCGAPRKNWMSAVGLLNLACVVLTVMSMVSMSESASELTAFGWIVSDTLVAGVFTFSRANVTTDSIPWAVDYGNLAMFNEVDQSGDGLLSRDEVIDAADILYMTPEEAGLFFDEVDIDEKGTLTKAEIEAHERFPFGRSWISGYHYDSVHGQMSVTSSWAKCALDLALVASLDPNAEAKDNVKKAEDVLSTLEKQGDDGKDGNDADDRTDSKKKKKGEEEEEDEEEEEGRRLGFSRHSVYEGSRSDRHRSLSDAAGFGDINAKLELESEVANWEGQPWLGRDFSDSAFGSGCEECASISNEVMGLQIASLVLVVPMAYKTFARSDADDDGVCTKIVGTVFPLWGMLIQLAALVLFDVGCATHLVAGGGSSSKKRGPGYWCAFTAAVLRAVIALMHVFQAKPTQVELDEEHGMKALTHPARDGRAYLPLSRGGDECAPTPKAAQTLEGRKKIREKEAARLQAQKAAVALAKKKLGATVGFTVALQEQTLASFGKGPQTRYSAAIAHSLGVAPAQVSVVSVSAGSVLAETKVSGFADEKVALAVAKKAADPGPTGLAGGLAKAGLGTVAVSKPIVSAAPNTPQGGGMALSALGDSDSDLSDSSEGESDREEDVGKGLLKKAAARGGGGGGGDSDESSGEVSDDYDESTIESSDVDMVGPEAKAAPAKPTSSSQGAPAVSNEVVGMAAAKKSLKEVGKSVKQMNSGVAGFGAGAASQKDHNSSSIRGGAAVSNEVVGMAAAKKSLKEVGKSVKQMNSGVAGFGAGAASQKDRKSSKATNNPLAAAGANANAPSTPTAKSSAASNVGTPGSIGAENMTQFFEENGGVGGQPKGTLLGHRDDNENGQADAPPAAAAPPSQAINSSSEPKRVAVRVYQARDIAAADFGFFSGPTSDPYVVLELVDPSDKRLKDTKKKKTRVVKKNLQPSWNEELVWEEVHHDLSDAFLKVTVCDADLVVSDPLGGFALPLSKGAPKGGSGSEWHALGAVTGMGKIVPSGFMKLGFAVTAKGTASTDAFGEDSAFAPPKAKPAAAAAATTTPADTAAAAAAASVSAAAPRPAAASSQAQAPLPPHPLVKTSNGPHGLFFTVTLLDKAVSLFGPKDKFLLVESLAKALHCSHDQVTVLSVKAGTSGAAGGVTAEISATGWLTAAAAATAALSGLGSPSAPAPNNNGSSSGSNQPYSIATQVRSAGLGNCSVSRPQPSVGGLRPGERGPPVEVRLVNRSPVVVDVWGAHEGGPEFESVKVLVPEGAGPGDSVTCQVASSSGKPKGRWVNVKMPAKLPQPGKVVKVKMALPRGPKCVAPSLPSGGGMQLVEVATGAELWFSLQGYKDDQIGEDYIVTPGKVEYVLPASVEVPRHSMFAAGSRAKRQAEIDERRKLEQQQSQLSASGGPNVTGGQNTTQKKQSLMETDPALAALVASAWTKILSYLHDDGKTQIAVAKRMVRLWKQAVQLADAHEEGELPQVTLSLSTYTKMGMELDARTARVTRIESGSQAEAKGITCGWTVKKVGTTPVKSLEGFATAINATRDQGVGEASVLFELDPASAAKAKHAQKNGGASGTPASPGSPVSQSVKISFLVSAFVAGLGKSRALTKWEQEAWFAVHDANNDGEISLSEFTAAINEAKEKSKRIAEAESASRPP